MKLDMPTAPVHDMKIQERDDDLVVATHGRGIYIADIAPLAELTPAVLAADAHLFTPEPEVRWVASDRTNYAFSNFEGESEEEGASLFYYLRNAGDVTITLYQGQVPISVIEDEGSAGVNVVQWNMQKWIERSAAEQERMREARSGQGGGGGGFQRGGPSAADRIRYAISDAAPGTYRVVLAVNGRDYESSVTILQDEWWEERR